MPTATSRVLCAVLLTLTGCVSDGAQQAPTPARTQPGPSRSASIDGIGEQTETFLRDERELRTTIWYPESDGEIAPGRHPVVVFSHGLGGLPGAYEELFTDWVREGFVVVGPTYPLTNAGVSTQPRDLVNQPADVSFVLDELSGLRGELGDAFDLENVAAVGHSLGGMTTVGLLRTCCDEPRLDAAVVYAGSGLGFQQHAFVDDLPPVLFVHGDRDEVVPIGGARRVYDDVDGPRAFITLLGASHGAPYFAGSDPHFDVVQDATLAFLRWTLLDEDSALDDFRKRALASDFTELDEDL